MDLNRRRLPAPAGRPRQVAAPATTVDQLIVYARDGRVSVMDTRGTGTVLADLTPGSALWFSARLREEAHRGARWGGHPEVGAADDYLSGGGSHRPAWTASDREPDGSAGS